MLCAPDLDEALPDATDDMLKQAVLALTSEHHRGPPLFTFTPSGSIAPTAKAGLTAAQVKQFRYESDSNGCLNRI